MWILSKAELRSNVVRSIPRCQFKLPRLKFLPDTEPEPEDSVVFEVGSGSSCSDDGTACFTMADFVDGEYVGDGSAAALVFLIRTTFGDYFGIGVAGCSVASHPLPLSHAALL